MQIDNYVKLLQFTFDYYSLQYNVSNNKQRIDIFINYRAGKVIRINWFPHGSNYLMSEIIKTTIGFNV